MVAKHEDVDADPDSDVGSDFERLLCGNQEYKYMQAQFTAVGSRCTPAPSPCPPGTDSICAVNLRREIHHHHG
ncbi:hypothetical protein QYE76_026073 [Lolium multiflorum]|jgi:hypothetical protein|uniref:Uncharacterized protein n=1 Tax=Lolium multiflorum TaxID=4521 RepID=A0AAD8VWJ1_LOLMU|nr:hypothetical protein QYE76_026073 [Lolium multiflorum]